MVFIWFKLIDQLYWLLTIGITKNARPNKEFHNEQVADLSMLRAETHKFESHYIDNLVGKLHKHISFIQ